MRKISHGDDKIVMPVATTPVAITMSAFRKRQTGSSIVADLVKIASSFIAFKIAFVLSS